MDSEHQKGCSDSEIAALVAHELKAPLTVIEGYLDLLATPLSDELREQAIASARNATRRMEALLQDLLAATCAEELFFPEDLTCVSLKCLAEEALDSARAAKSHTFELDASCPGWVMGEQRRLEQVLANLISNAVKYSPAHGTVRVRVVCEGTTVTLSVEDEGPGVPEKDRERVFEQFTRLSSEGSKRPGVGLGLYIVRAIVAGHGGSIHVEEAAGGQGARFVVSLPATSCAD